VPRPSLKYQVPHDDLDSLISVSSDDDVDHLMDELDRLHDEAAVATARQLRLRTFFLAPVPDAAIGSILLGTAGDVASTDQCKLEEARTRDIVVDAVAIEHKFIHDAFPVALFSMNGTLTSQYMEIVADCLLMALRVWKLR